MLPEVLTVGGLLLAILLMVAPKRASGRASTPGGEAAAQAFLDRLRALAASPGDEALRAQARAAADAWLACVTERPVRATGEGAFWLMVSLSGWAPGDPRGDADDLLARAARGKPPKSRPWF